MMQNGKIQMKDNMKKIRFSRIGNNTKFNLNEIEYTKTSHRRGWRVVNGRKEFLYIKKAKLVEINES